MEIQPQPTPTAFAPPALPRRERHNPAHQFRVPGAVEAPEPTLPGPEAPFASPSPEPDRMDVESIRRMRRYGPLSDWTSQGDPRLFNLDRLSGVRPNTDSYTNQRVLRTVETPQEEPSPSLPLPITPLGLLRRAGQYLRSRLEKPANRADQRRPGRPEGRHRANRSLLRGLGGLSLRFGHNTAHRAQSGA